jgi:replicative DNA helicase
MATVRNLPPAASWVAPPHSLEAEREVLAAVFIDPTGESAGMLCERLCAGDFFAERHQVIFAAVKSLHEAGTAVDIVTVRQALVDSGRFEKVGMQTLSGLLDRAGMVANLPHYIATVREKATRRRVLEAARAVEAAVHSSFDGDLEAALERLDRAKAERVAFQKPVESWFDATEANAAAVYDAPRSPVVSSGIPELDEHLPAGGFEGGNLIVVIGPPKTGKTTYALGTLTRQACEEGKRVLYCALSDAGVRRLNRKMIAGVSGVPERGVKRGDLTSEQSANWIWAAEKVSKWKLHVERNPDPRAIVARAKALSAEGDLALVVVDYLQRTKTGAREMWQDMAAATGTLQDGAVDLDIPFVVLSQPTTEARRSGKAIKASDTKGGGTAEEDGDLVLLLAKGVHDPGAAGLAILAGRDVEPKVWHAESCVVDGKSVAACGWRWNYRSMRLESR